MSGLAKNFDKISNIYRNIAKNIYDPALKISLEQINTHVDKSSGINKILDLGCGDGKTLLHVKDHFPQANFTGVDISKKMLAEAANKMTLTTIQSDIGHIDNLLPKHQFDLSFAHFVLGYIDMNTLLNKANYLLRDKRFISITTNSEDSFCGIKNIVRESCSKIKPLKKFIDYKINQGFKKSKNQIDWNNIESITKTHNFDVISLEKLNVECEFANSKDLFNYIFYGSWGIGELKPYIPLSIYRLCYTTFLNRLMEFPFKDRAQVNILLLKRAE
jgi:ubiquinone/menaquinone biosynthesis C-methylase UbiE